MTRDHYIQLLADILSRDTDRVREANRELYKRVVKPRGTTTTQPDLALAEAARLTGDERGER